MTFEAWLNDSDSIEESARAAIAWARIQDRPTSVQFKTPAGTTLAAQTVRIEMDDDPAMMTDAGMTGQTRKGVVFGVRGHATLADTVMAEGYRFIYNNDEYRIVDVLLTLGSLQAAVEAVG